MLRDKQGGSEPNIEKNHSVYQQACSRTLIRWQRKQKQTQRVNAWGCRVRERQMREQAREEVRKGKLAGRQEEGC